MANQLLLRLLLGDRLCALGRLHSGFGFGYCWNEPRFRRRRYGGLLRKPEFCRPIEGSRGLDAAHAVVAAALREGRRLVVLRTQEIVTLGDSVELVRLIKGKLCELAVKGTVV